MVKDTCGTERESDKWRKSELLCNILTVVVGYVKSLFPSKFHTITWQL